jgi:hypothetical protein
MDFGIIALGVVLIGKVLDYVAPKTKNTVDDKIRDVFNRGKDMVLPLLEKVFTAKSDRPADPAPVESNPIPRVTTTAEGTVRDHRS